MFGRRSSGAGPRPQVTAADYAAIGVAPLLIFVMLLAVVHFLLLLIYRGGYPFRVAWITSMVTMGMVAGARLGIEEGRQRAMAYVGVLAVAGVFVLTKFVGSMAVAVLLVAVIGVLADRIVADCTLIDESIDASGRGLIDLEGVAKKTGKKGHQPGRTVLYLAIAALPLFGLGQFGMRESVAARGRWLLTAYLFASLSLLVVTAFLNLRRYLRQRGTEMSTNTTVAWLAGGIASIAAVLAVAWLAPLPGRTLAQFETPDWLANVESFDPSDFGWGSEGAGQQPQPDGTAGKPSEPTGDDRSPDKPPSAESSQPSSSKPNPDAAAGQSGPAQAGSGGADSEQTADGGKAPPAKSSKSGGDPGGSGSQKSESSTPPERSGGQAEGGKQPSGEPPSGEQSGGQKQPGREQANDQQAGAKSSDQSAPDISDDGQPSSTNDSQSASEANSPSDNQSGDDQPSDNQPNGETEGDNQSTDSQSDASSNGNEQGTDADADSPPPPSQSPTSNPLSGLFDLVAGLMRWLFFAVLVAFGAWWFYTNREAIADWWRSLLTGEEPAMDPEEVIRQRRGGKPPPRFDSFRNPIGTQPPDEAIVITFAALQAWGREHKLPPRAGETPDEYARRIAGEHPAFAKAAAVVVDAYNRVLYGKRAGQDAKVTRRELAAGEQLWAAMR